jgi:NADH dehydrogenase [ubiquinone] 1 alpha subcomplex assembly factor 5
MVFQIERLTPMPKAPMPIMPAPPTPRIFDTAELRQWRERAARHWPRALPEPPSPDPLWLQRLTAASLLERRADIRRSLPQTLLLGSFAAEPSAALLTSAPRLIMADSAFMALPSHAQAAVVLDEAALPFASGCCDAVLSNLTLQSANDVLGTLRQYRHTLAAGGVLLGAVLGGNSLWQLRDCFYRAEQAELGGISPRIAPMIAADSATLLLHHAGFMQPVVDVERLEVVYTDALALLRDLRQMGLSAPLVGRLHHTPRRVFAHMAALYAAQHPAPAGEAGILAQFDIIYVHGWAED